MAEKITSHRKRSSAATPTEEHDEDEDLPGIGHNGLDQEAYLLHQQAMVRSNVEQALFRAKRKSVRKLAKSAGVDLGKMDLMSKMLDWEPDDIRDFFKTVWQYAVWTRLAPNEQGSLFGQDDGPAMPDFAQDELDWEMKGRNIGMKGEELKVPDGCGGDRVQAFTRGWHEGQAMFIVKNIKKLEPAEAN